MMSYSHDSGPHHRVHLLDLERPTPFEKLMLPHMAAAYNLARWLTRQDSDASDVVQEAYVRAFKFFDSYHGGNARSWILTIVRNTCYTWLRQNRSHDIDAEFDETAYEAPETSQSPEARLIQSANQELVRKAIEEIPLEFREIVILRDLEGLSYKEIVEVTGLPMGTVMSRLSRARHRLQGIMSEHLGISGGPLAKEIEREL